MSTTQGLPVIYWTFPKLGMITCIETFGGIHMYLTFYSTMVDDVYLVPVVLYWRDIHHRNVFICV
jgi:hypothetical protein